MSKLSNFTNEELSVIAKQSSSFKQFLRKIGYSTASGDLYNAVRNELNRRGILTDSIVNKDCRKRRLTESDVFCYPSLADQTTLRKYVLRSGLWEYKCAICGNDGVWNGKPLSLTLDHINGDNKDNRKENLRWVCPNCDRQLSTFGGRNQRKAPKHFCLDCGAEITKYAVRCQRCANKKSSPLRAVNCERIKWPGETELLQMVRENNFEGCGRILGVSGNAVRKHLVKLGAIDKLVKSSALQAEVPV